MVKTACRVLSACIAVSLWGYCQAPVSTYHATTRLVQVPVTVLNGNGQFLNGLRKRNFRLWVDGKPMPIAYLDITRNMKPRPRRTYHLPPGAVTNRQESGVLNRIVFLFDFSQIPLSQLSRLRAQMLRLFSRPLPRYTDAAILSETAWLQLDQPFTRNTRLLRQAIRAQFHPGRGTGMNYAAGWKAKISEILFDQAQYMTAMAGMPGGGDGGIVHIGQSDMAQAEYRRLKNNAINLLALARMLNGMHGHKNLLWFTSDTSFTITPPGYSEAAGVRHGPQPGAAFRQTNQLALWLMNAADASLYFINPRGLSAYTANAGSSLLNRPSWVSNQNPAIHDLVWENENVPARATGGMALNNSNDIAGLARQAIERFQDQYILYFKPDFHYHSQMRYHKIRVRLAGAHGQIWYRHGYLQFARNHNLMFAQNFHPSRHFVLSPLDWTQLPLTLAPGGRIQGPMPQYWKGPPHLPLVREWPFSLHIAARRLIHQYRNGYYYYDFDVDNFSIPQTSGKILRLPLDHYRRLLSPAEAKALLRSGEIRYKGRFVLPAHGRYLCRTVVRDNVSGRIGTVTILMPKAASTPARLAGAR